MPVATLTPFRVNPRAFHEFIIMPQFGDVLDEKGQPIPSDEEGDWMIMDNVVVDRPIIELWGGQNVLKRKDATCKLIYSPVGRLTNRRIKTEALYAAVEDCQDEFYQGCFEDYEQENFQMFFENVMPILEKGVGTDIFTNKYFGDVTRESDINGIWSWNKFDGIFTHLKKYIADGTIGINQSFAIDEGAIVPQAAKDALEEAYANQPTILKSIPANMKAFYVDQETYDAYNDWLILSGNVGSVEQRQNTLGGLRYRGIDLKIKQWDGILAALNGGQSAHIILLTVTGNFLYATDSNYGGGPKRNEAVRIWWSDDDNIWKRQIHLKAGTEWAAPQLVVIGMTDF